MGGSPLLCVGATHQGYPFISFTGLSLVSLISSAVCRRVALTMRWGDPSRFPSISFTGTIFGIPDLICRWAGRPYYVLGRPIKVILYLVYQAIMGIPDLICRWAGRPYYVLGRPIKVILYLVYRDIMGIPDLICR